jgi:hypothetical protein
MSLSDTGHKADGVAAARAADSRDMPMTDRG